jgi:hypothetical protein
MSDPTNLTDKQEAAIGFLLTERTQEKAAEKAGVGSATLRRWLGEPAFAAAYRLARRQLVEAAVGQLQQVTSEAVDALRRNLTCGNPCVEVRAATTILEQAVKGVELADLVEEVETLKGLFAEKEKQS